MQYANKQFHSVCPFLLLSCCHDEELGVSRQFSNVLWLYVIISRKYKRLSTAARLKNVVLRGGGLDMHQSLYVSLYCCAYESRQSYCRRQRARSAFAARAGKKHTRACAEARRSGRVRLGLARECEAQRLIDGGEVKMVVSECNHGLASRSR